MCRGVYTSDESKLSSARIQLELARLMGFSARLGSWDIRASSCHKNWPKRAESGAWAKKGQYHNHNDLKCWSIFKIMYHCLVFWKLVRNKTTCAQHFLHTEKEYFYVRKKFSTFLSQLVFSSFCKDGQLGSAWLVKIQLELISTI